MKKLKNDPVVIVFAEENVIFHDLFKLFQYLQILGDH